MFTRSLNRLLVGRSSRSSTFSAREMLVCLCSDVVDGSDAPSEKQRLDEMLVMHAEADANAVRADTSLAAAASTQALDKRSHGEARHASPSAGRAPGQNNRQIEIMAQLQQKVTSAATRMGSLHPHSRARARPIWTRLRGHAWPTSVVT